MKHALFILSLLLIATGAFAQVSAESPLTPERYFEAPRRQIDPQVASDGENFLAVWTDYRTDPNHGNPDVFATRVAADGTILDPAGIVLEPTFSEDHQAAVVFNGESYLAVFATTYFDLGMTAVEIGTDGVPRASHSLVRPGRVQHPAIAWNGSGYLAVWRDWGTGELRAAMFDRGLHPIVAPFTIAAGGTTPSLASNGSGFLVSWSEPEKTLFTTISAAGAIEREPVVIGGGATTAVTWDGARYALALGGKYASVIQLSASGERLRERALGDESGAPASQPAIVWTGDRYIVVWTSSPFPSLHENVERAELDANLEWLAPAAPIRPRAKAELQPAVAANANGRALLLWNEGSFDGADVNGALLDRNAPVESAQAFVVGRGVNDQVVLDAETFADGTTGVIWTEHWTVMFGRTRPDGTMAGEPLDLGADSASSLAASETQAVVVAVRGNVRFELVRIDLATMRIVSRTPLPETARGSVLIASNGRDFAVTWTTHPQVPNTTAAESTTFAATFSAEGTLGPTRRLSPESTDPYAGYQPYGLLRNGSEYVALLVKSVRNTPCGRFCTASRTQLLALRLTSTLESAGSYVVVDAPRIGFASVATNGSEVMYVWSEFDGLTAQQIVYFRRFTGEGSPLEPPKNVFTNANVSFAAALFDGRRLGIVSTTLVTEGEQAFFYRITTTPIVDGASGEAHAFEHRWPIGGFAVAGGFGRIAYVYSHPQPRTPGAHLQGVTRAFVRFAGRTRERVVH